jgi:zinc protease
VRIEWTCDPARTALLVQRVFAEIEFIKATSLSREQVGRVRDALLREHEQNSQDNGYFLNDIARRYLEGQPGARSLPDQIAALTGAAIQQAAQTYLNAGTYVKVVLMPAAK